MPLPPGQPAVLPVATPLAAPVVVPVVPAVVVPALGDVAVGGDAAGLCEAPAHPIAPSTQQLAPTIKARFIMEVVAQCSARRWRRPRPEMRSFLRKSASRRLLLPAAAFVARRRLRFARPGIQR